MNWRSCNDDRSEHLISIIIPANNEADLIGRCLGSLLTGKGPDRGEVIVVANGCSDDTAACAAAFSNKFALKGWALTVIDLKQGGKPNALNAGDAAAKGDKRVYLDADIVVSPDLLAQLDDILSKEAPVYASGTMRIAQAETWVSRAYGRIYARVPFMTHGVPGAGLFAVNAAGRARWGDFPQIISDDTFVRLSFSPNERIAVPAPYDWPLVEGFSTLVRVRRRQNTGVDEIRNLYPALLQNDDKHRLGLSGMLRLALTDPIGFAVYTAVAIAVRFGPRDTSNWERGR
ncbi:MAG: glycosyltransferase [Pseudoruegeria sp.]|uniref:glycosyltransferase family 2 protein n=1 Tax=Shimia thalassica TaxID=1715693 RepID=UPI003299A03C